MLLINCLTYVRRIEIMYQVLENIEGLNNLGNNKIFPSNIFYSIFQTLLSPDNINQTKGYNV